MPRKEKHLLREYDDRKPTGECGKKGLKESEATTKRICCVTWCESNHYARGFCSRHYQQIRLHGEAKRTGYDLNEINIKDNTAQMVLYDRRGNRVTTTTIDADMVEKIDKYRWHLHRDGYARASTGIFLHLLIMGQIPNGKIADHVNRNRLDNRRDNLRFVNHQQNARNRSTHTNNTSGATGVAWHKDSTKWCAYISINGRRVSLGYFKKKEDAVKVRRKAEEKYYETLTQGIRKSQTGGGMREEKPEGVRNQS